MNRNQWVSGTLAKHGTVGLVQDHITYIRPTNFTQRNAVLNRFAPVALGL